ALAHRPGEDRLDGGRQGCVLLVDVKFDAGGNQGFVCAREFCGKRRLPIPGDRLANFAQRVACHFLDVLNLVAGLTGTALDQSPRELAFERDHRQAMADQIVKVTGNRSRSSPTASRAICSRARDSCRFASINSRPATTENPTMASLMSSPSALSTVVPRTRSRTAAVSAAATTRGMATRQRKAAAVMTTA